jgi:hypothetical protein
MILALLKEQPSKQALRQCKGDVALIAREVSTPWVIILNTLGVDVTTLISLLTGIIFFGPVIKKTHVVTIRIVGANLIVLMTSSIHARKIRTNYSYFEPMEQYQFASGSSPR